MCGIIGIFGTLDASKLVLLGLHALQHRGQEGAGIASTDGKNIHWFRAKGLVADIFSDELTSSLKGHSAIGHIRYSTTGQSDPKNLQPVVVDGLKIKFAIAHNGNLVNFATLRAGLEERGSVFTSEMDTEVIAHLIATNKSDDFPGRLSEALSRAKGAWSLLILTQDSLIAVRDPLGFRPLAMGMLKRAYIFSSETCAFDLMGAEFIREVEPGEMVIASERGIETRKLENTTETKMCIFEHIYFSRPDSFVFGEDVWRMRLNLGVGLAKEQPCDANLVMPVPDSGLFAALGYSQGSGIPFGLGLMRSHYVGRTFIEPKTSARSFDVRVKLNPVKGIVSGKKVVLVDDSIVRGTTSQKIVKMLKDAGAKEVHMRISSPPIKYPCFFGIDTPSKGELIASSHSIDEIARFIGCNSLGYISVDGMLKSCKGDMKKYCTACFTGDYPMSIEDSSFIVQLRLFRNA